MRRKPLFPNERWYLSQRPLGQADADDRWCFPEGPPRVPVTDPDEHWCFPERPPRVPVTDPDDRWCFPERPPRGRRNRPRGSRM